MDRAEGLVGREALCARVDEMLATHGRVELQGPAGIGKTAVWSSVVTAADQTVLVARATAAEQPLRWVGLTDLLSAIDDFDGLPDPQHDALATVTLRRDQTTAPADERAVGTALATLLSQLASARPVMLAIDDAPLLDEASAMALQFALRRLPADGGRLQLLTTARSGAQTVDLGCEPCVVEALSVASVFQLLRSRLGLVFPRPTLVRIHEASGGNPLYAMEIARALDRSEIRTQPGAPLGVPDSLASLLADRLARTRPEVRLLVASSAAAPRLRAELTNPDVLAAAIDEAYVTVEDGQVRPAHPLLAATAYGALALTERATLHLSLAEQALDPVERARHLALGDSDASILPALDAGVAAAAARGDVGVAAELSRMANRLAPPDSIRLSSLADLLFQGGDTNGAVTAQRQAIASAPSDAARCQARIRLAEFMVEADDWPAAIPELQVALADAGADAELAAEVHLTWSAVSYGDLAAAEEHGTRAVSLLESLADPDPAVMAGALTQAGAARFRAGHGLDATYFRSAIELERRSPSRRLSDRADAAYAALLKYADDLETAQSMLRELRAEAEASGDVSSLVYVLFHAAHAATWSGDLVGARALAQTHVTLAESSGMSAQAATARYQLGLITAYDGIDFESAVVQLQADLEVAATAHNVWDEHRLEGALGALDWARNSSPAALPHFHAWWRLGTQVRLGEPGYVRHHLDYAEALVAAGRLEQASAFLTELDALAQRSGRGYAHAVVAAGRAMVSSASGDATEARQFIETALRLHENLPLRFDRARCLHIAGRIHRRGKAKLAARDALTMAGEEFRAMGAAPWLSAVEAELARVNVRPSAPSELTETERRVADLAAAGLTNRQVAERLFIATKTVEANLAHVYRKLGISSRAELGARLGRDHAG